MNSLMIMRRKLFNLAGEGGGVAEDRFCLYGSTLMSNTEEKDVDHLFVDCL
jgi:hypothetical protein